MSFPICFTRQGKKVLTAEYAVSYKNEVKLAKASAYVDLVCPMNPAPGLIEVLNLATTPGLVLFSDEYCAEPYPQREK